MRGIDGTIGMAVALALLGLPMVDAAAAADRVPSASGCVTLSEQGFEKYKTNYSVRLKAANSCEHAVTIHMKSNSLEVDCLPGSFTVGPGDTYRTHVALVPHGERARWNWCAEYSSDAVQERSGHRGCILSGQPRCP